MPGNKDLRDPVAALGVAAGGTDSGAPSKPEPSEAVSPVAESASELAKQPSEASEPTPVNAPSRAPAAARRAIQPLSAASFELRTLPILWVLVLTTGLLLLPTLIVDTVSDVVGLPVYGSELANTVASHTVMLLLALGVIWIYVRSGRNWQTFGINWPPGRSYVPTAFIIGILFGCAMAFVDYAPDIFAHKPLHGYEFHPSSPVGWLAFQGLYVGPTEEIPFRALLVGYLAVAMPGKIRFGRFEMTGAGIVVAAIFAIGFGLYALIAKDFVVAMGEAIYIFVGSTALAYWLEKSKSIVAPIVGHNAALLTWQVLVFWMVYASH